MALRGELHDNLGILDGPETPSPGTQERSGEYTFADVGQEEAAPRVVDTALIL